MYTGHHGTLAKVSNGILIGLTDQGETCVTKYYKLSVILNNIFMKTVFEIMFRWCLTYDAVRICFTVMIH